MWTIYSVKESKGKKVFVSARSKSNKPREYPLLEVVHFMHGEPYASNSIVIKRDGKEMDSFFTSTTSGVVEATLIFGLTNLQNDPGPFNGILADWFKIGDELCIKDKREYDAYTGKNK